RRRWHSVRRSSLRNGHSASFRAPWSPPPSLVTPSQMITAGPPPRGPADDRILLAIGLDRARPQRPHAVHRRLGVDAVVIDEIAGDQGAGPAAAGVAVHVHAPSLAQRAPDDAAHALDLLVARRDLRGDRHVVDAEAARPVGLLR